MDTTLSQPRGYRQIKELAKATGRNIPSLLALDRTNDPFFCGSPTDIEKGKWFLDVWQSYNKSMVHLRRLHYWAVSVAFKIKGEAYQNTEACWSYLEEASQKARYLGLVDAAKIVDHRNPQPLIMVEPRESEPETGWGVFDHEWALPKIAENLRSQINLDPPAVYVDGFDYSPADQPYHLEVWIEKSTANDILVPICRQLGINFVSSVGFQSITGVVNLMQRIAKRGKPARIWYIADFDPAGSAMPIAVARQAEFWHQTYAPGTDVKITALALTRHQVERFQLPRTPVKDSDTRKANFEERYGEGAVELDALEALHPGELARVVSQATQPFRDETLAKKLEQAGLEAQAEASAQWEEAIRDQAHELGKLKVEANSIAEKYQDRLRILEESLQVELAPLRKQMTRIERRIDERSNDTMITLPNRPEPDAGPTDAREWLFQSGRDYLEQLEVYQKVKGTQP